MMPMTTVPTTSFGEADECPYCRGEGYFYRANEGRHAEHPVFERRCENCLGTGVQIRMPD